MKDTLENGENQHRELDCNYSTQRYIDQSCGDILLVKYKNTNV